MRSHEIGFVVVASFAALLACGDEGIVDVPQPVHSEIAIPAETLEVLDTVALSHVGYTRDSVETPLGGGTVWTVEDERVVRIDSAGVLAAVGEGQTLIRAVSGTHVAEAVIDVGAGTGRVVAISSKNVHACALREDGAAFCWQQPGAGYAIALGVGDTVQRRHPHPVATDVRFKDISTGTYHTCAVALDGTGWCWGINWFGQLGAGDTETDPRIRRVEGGPWQEIEAGWNHTCGIDTDGAAWCWGDNYAGVLGVGEDGDPGNAGRLVSSVPLRVAGDLRFRQLSSGGDYVCGVTVDGEAYCWGENVDGVLGNGTTESRNAPTRVDTSARFQYVKVSIGATFLTASAPPHACGRTTDGAMMCWGNNSFSQLGAAAPAVALRPVPFIEASLRSIAPRNASTCGVTGDFKPACWGGATALAGGNPAFRVAESHDDCFISEHRALYCPGLPIGSDEYSYEPVLVPIPKAD